MLLREAMTDPLLERYSYAIRTYLPAHLSLSIYLVVCIYSFS